MRDAQGTTRLPPPPWPAWLRRCSTCKHAHTHKFAQAAAPENQRDDPICKLLRLCLPTTCASYAVRRQQPACSNRQQHLPWRGGRSARFGKKRKKLAPLGRFTSNSSRNALCPSVFIFVVWGQRGGLGRYEQGVGWRPFCIHPSESSAIPSKRTSF